MRTCLKNKIETNEPTNQDVKSISKNIHVDSSAISSVHFSQLLWLGDIITGLC